MKIMKFGSRGPNVQFLQLALNRAGAGPVLTDGLFGYATQNAVTAFQRSHSLPPDGIVGPQTEQALMPWYTGFIIHTIRPGDTLYTIARMHHTTVRRVETANPGLDPFQLIPGTRLTVPLAFPVVPTTIDWTSDVLAKTVVGLSARYPIISVDSIGRSQMGVSIPCLALGTGPVPVLYNAAHHVNEWITTPILMKFAEDLAQAAMRDRPLYGISVRELLQRCRVYLVPMVNPDGVDLVTGMLTEGAEYDHAREIAANYPDIPFPAGWKANIAGIDLNLQYPAGWEQVRAIKFAQGFCTPAPRDYVGPAPLSAPESRAMAEFTQSLRPRLTLSYHTQGRVIYWKYLDYEPEHSRAIAYRFAAASGYLVEQTPYTAGFAGYKDWFLENYHLPGYTIEVGLGENPLPLSQFEQIYQENLGILVLGAYLAAEIAP